MVNKIIIIGHLGKDPEIRTTNNGNKVATFSVATSKNWKDKDSGEKHSKSEWHRVVCWSKSLIDAVIQPYCKKGSKVYVEGTMEYREWDDTKTIPHHTIKRQTAEINIKMGGTLMLFDKKEGDSSYSHAPEPEIDNYDIDDEIPF